MTVTTRPNAPLVREIEEREPKTPFWWRVLYIEAEERMARGEPPFTKWEFIRACRWQTCACGKQDARIPRSKSGAPEDCELIKLGTQFPEMLKMSLDAFGLGSKTGKAIARIYVQEARDTMHKIEKRAGELLAGSK